MLKNNQSCTYKITHISIGASLKLLNWYKTKLKLELMFMKQYAPKRCLYIKVEKLRTGVGECRDVTPTKLQSQNIFKESTGGSGWGGGGVRMDVNEELKFL